MSLPIFIPGTDNRYWAGTTGKITDAYSGLEVPTYIKEPYLGPLVDLEVDGKKKAYLASCATTEEPFLRRAYFPEDTAEEVVDAPKEVRALRHNSGKPDLTYLPPNLLMSAGAVFTYGASKYSPGNHLHSIGTEEHDNYHRTVCASFLRHTMQYMAGEETDDESGEAHLGHMLTNLAILWSYDEGKK